MRSIIIRFGISLTVVLAASSLYFFHGAVHSGAAAPWVWAFLLQGLVTAREVLPISPTLWFLATVVSLAACAVRPGVSFVVTGWCALNAVAASIMNFQLYAA